MDINKDRIIENFCQMVKIPSESNNDLDFVKYLAQYFQEMGASIKLDTYGNLLASFKAKNSSSLDSVLLSAHADTVSPGIGIEPVVQGDLIRSVGDTILGADDKAGIAIIIEAIKSSSKHPNIEVLITRDEEIGSIGAKNCELYKDIKSKFGYALDTDFVNEVVIGGPTFIKLDFEFIGKLAHAGVEPEKGINAIVAASNAISRIKFGRIDKDATSNVGIIKGGTIRNGVPETCTFYAEARSTDDEKCLNIVKNMKDTCINTAKEFSCKCNINELVRAKAYKLNENSKCVDLVKNAMKEIDVIPEVKVINGGSDASSLTLNGVDTVLLACGFRNPHTKEEKAVISDMLSMVKILNIIFSNI